MVAEGIMASNLKIAKVIDNHPLAKAKIVYFFYEAIAKSLPPYLASYYKHTLLLSPHQVSVLVAARYLSILFGSPVLGSLADKLNRFRYMLVLTLVALLVTYCVVPLVEPIDGFNCKEHLHNGIIKSSNFTHNHTEVASRGTPDTFTMPKSIPGHYHSSIMSGMFYTWPFETWEYEETDAITRKVFLTLLIVTLIGEFFASPTETFLDFYTLQTLKSERNKYGFQILPGLFGWMIVSVIFAILKYSKESTDDFCHFGYWISNTPYLFVVYGMITICIFVALLFKYTLHTEEKDRNLSCRDILHSNCLKAFILLFQTPSYAAFSLAVIFAGFGNGVKVIFIYSYISELGGGIFLVAVVMGVHFVSNFIAIVMSPFFLKKFGHEYLISAGLFVYGVTFVVYSLIENPILVLLVEPFDGICSSLCWITIVTYAGCPPQIGAALQGLIHGLYRGLGVAIGYFVVSICILKYGYFALFIGLGLIYFVIFGLYVCVFHLWPKKIIAEEYTLYTLLFPENDVADSDSEYELSFREDEKKAGVADTVYLK